MWNIYKYIYIVNLEVAADVLQWGPTMNMCVADAVWIKGPLGQVQSALGVRLQVEGK